MAFSTCTDARNIRLFFFAISLFHHFSSFLHRTMIYLIRFTLQAFRLCVCFLSTVRFLLLYDRSIIPEFSICNTHRARAEYRKSAERVMKFSSWRRKADIISPGAKCKIQWTFLDHLNVSSRLSGLAGARARARSEEERGKRNDEISTEEGGEFDPPRHPLASCARRAELRDATMLLRINVTPPLGSAATINSSSWLFASDAFARTAIKYLC